jgi:hypothetical protein
LATQRISKLHKDAAAECNNKLIGRTNLDIDMRRSAEELGFTERDKKLALRNLEAGEFFAFGPAISREVIKVKVGSVQTSHHEAGTMGYATSPAPPTARIKKLLSALQDLPKEAEQEAKTIADYQRQIHELKRQWRHRRDAQGTGTAGPSKETIAATVQQALKAQELQFAKEKEQLIGYANTLHKRLTAIQQALRTIRDEPLPSSPYASSADDSEHIPGVRNWLEDSVPPEGNKEDLPQIPEKTDREIHGERPQYLEHPLIKKWLGKLDGRSKEMFTHIIQAYPGMITRKELAIKMGLAVKGGYFYRNLQALRKKGIIGINFGKDLVWALDALFD